MKKALLYISVGLGVTTLTYYILGGGKYTNRNKKEDEGENKEPQQSKPDSPLTEAIAKNTLVGKTIKTKVSDAKIRRSAEANDGVANNTYGVVASANTTLGKVVRVYQSKNSKNPATGKNYYWISFEMTDDVYNEIQSRLSFLTRDLWKNVPPPSKTWIREDVVKL